MREGKGEKGNINNDDYVIFKNEYTDEQFEAPLM